LTDDSLHTHQGAGASRRRDDMRDDLKDDRLAVQERLIMRERVRATKLTPNAYPEARNAQRPVHPRHTTSVPHGCWMLRRVARLRDSSSPPGENPYAQVRSGDQGPRRYWRHAVAIAQLQRVCSDDMTPCYLCNDRLDRAQQNSSQRCSVQVAPMCPVLEPPFPHKQLNVEGSVSSHKLSEPSASTRRRGRTR
jgi:hypothetical protein